MSLTKRILFDKDPAHDEIRKRIFGDPNAVIPQYPFGAPLRRKNRLAESPHWDPLWPRRLSMASAELGLDHVVVNSRMMFRTEDARDAAMRRAEQLWAEEIARRHGVQTG